MTADEEFRSIPAMAQRSAERFGERVAVVDGETAMTFAEVAAGMVRVARALIAMGVQRGDRVAIWAPNSARWITCALGIHAAGAWLVPLNTRFKGGEAAYVLEKSDSFALLTVSSFLGTDYLAMVRNAAPDLRALQHAVTIDDDASWAQFLALGDGVDEAEVHRRIEAIRPEDVADIMFTSGTTGHPKGVMLRHGTSLRAYRDGYNVGFELGEGDVTIIFSPFFHCFGYKAGWMIALAVGATAVPIPVFDPESALATIERLGVTHLSGAPTFFVAMLNHPNRDRYDRSTIKMALTSAAYVPVELLQRIRGELGAKSAITGYGLTEAHAMVSVSMPGDDAEYTAAWSGKVLPGVRVRIVDDHGNDVALGDRGELLVSGYTLMEGYYGDPEATAKVIDADGWLHTGDIAYANEAGYIKICDRKKDMYIMGGFNVAPAEVEGLLLEWDRIAQAAVIGIADPHFGEVGAAFVVPRPGVELTPDEVVAYAREHMANFKVPRRVEIVDALPLNATGKVLKTELRARVNSG